MVHRHIMARVGTYVVIGRNSISPASDHRLVNFSVLRLRYVPEACSRTCCQVEYILIGTRQEHTIRIGYIGCTGFD